MPNAVVHYRDDANSVRIEFDQYETLTILRWNGFTPGQAKAAWFNLVEHNVSIIMPCGTAMHRAIS